MIELRHLDIRHFGIEECSHLATGCTTKCGCIGLILFHCESCLRAIISNIDTIGFVSELYACSVVDVLVANCAAVH